MDEQRLIDLETRAAFQEDAIQQLSDVVYRQQKQIDQLENLCKLLAQKIQDLDAGDLIDTSDEKPPHY